MSDKRINKTEALKLVRSFIEKELINEKWYLNIKPHVKAMVLYGSVAKELNRPDSDIDFLIFVPLEIEEKYTSGEYFFTFENYEINIVLRSIELLRKLATERNDFEAEVFKGSEIIWERDSEVRDLIKRIKGGQN